MSLGTKKSKRPAPKHPPGPETKIRKALDDAFAPIAKQLASAISNGDADAIRRLRAQLTDALDLEKFDDMVRVAAVETADSARRQLAKIVGLDPGEFDPDLDQEIDTFVGNLHTVASDAVADLVDRADELLDQDDVTTEDAHDGLVGALGTMLARASMAFTYSFAQFNQAAFEEAGVDEYVWTSHHDDKVRDAHEYLDGITVSWDDYPLGAEESSSGEECKVGEDYNCRCVPSPVVNVAEVAGEAEDAGEQVDVEREAA